MRYSGKTLKQRQLETGRTLALDGAAWRRLREVILFRDPLCVCGCGRPSTDVDHINNDPTDNDMDNLAGMARECHSRKTQRDQGHKVAMGCDADGYPLDPDHDWQKSRESLGDKPTGSLYAHRRS